MINPVRKCYTYNYNFTNYYGTYMMLIICNSFYLILENSENYLHIQK